MIPHNLRAQSLLLFAGVGNRWDEPKFQYPFSAIAQPTNRAIPKNGER